MPPSAELWAVPKRVGTSASARDAASAAERWRVSESLTGHRYAI